MEVVSKLPCADVTYLLITCANYLSHTCMASPTTAGISHDRGLKWVEGPEMVNYVRLSCGRNVHMHATV